jgi:hypothetical protein
LNLDSSSGSSTVHIACMTDESNKWKWRHGWYLCAHAMQFTRSSNERMQFRGVPLLGASGSAVLSMFPDCIALLFSFTRTMGSSFSPSFRFCIFARCTDFDAAEPRTSTSQVSLVVRGRPT